MTRGASHDVLVASCAASAGVHAGLAPAHGAAFTAAAVVLAAAAAVLARRPASRRAVVVAGAVLASMLAAYLLVQLGGGTAIGLERESLTPTAAATKAIELAGVSAAVALLRGRPATRPAPLPVAALVAVFAALLAVAAGDGHEHHNAQRIAPSSLSSASFT